MSLAAEIEPGKIADVHFPTRRLGHANAYVSNRDTAFAFYNGVCGFDSVGHSKSSYFLSNGNSHHDFGLNGSGSGAPRVGTDGVVKSVDNYRGPGTLNHLGWETTNQADLVAAYKRALDSEVRIMRTLFHGGSHALYLFDPDGVYHEFYADATLEWRAIFAGGDASAVTSGWDPLAGKPDPKPYWDPKPIWVTVDKAPVHPRRVSRTVIYVSDMAKLLPFYTDVAGLSLMYLARDKSYAYLRGAAKQSSFDICLLTEDRPGQAGTYYRVAAEMADEAAIETAEARLAKTGVPIAKRYDDARKRSFFLIDPDNVPIEFFVERQPDYEALARIPRSERPYAA